MKAWSGPDVPTLSPDPTLPRVYDTASQALVEVGREDAPARLYVCGITPYDATHLGHANTYLAFDLLQRVWRDAGREVVYTQNVTDVDDPLLERAEATGVAWEDLAEGQVELFRTDMEALRVIPPQHYVGAVESIPLVVDLIERLLPTGLVYQVDDPEHPDWYFACSQAHDFGEVSNLDRATAVALFGERGGDPDRPGKRDALDCLVWRMARDGEPSWDSALGRGRPGWHIECTAIALQFLGETFDVQGGGSDLIFPHHEMCATEARAATGEAFADAYVHAGMVGYEGEKMSKSKGNLVLVSRLREQGVDPMAIRLVLLAHHYREDWEYTDADLARAQERLAAWRGAMNDATGMPAGETVAAVRAALRDDLDAPSALAAVDAWVAASAAIDSDDTDAPGDIQRVVDALLGVILA
ncbi:cysteine--1-D-myo-inosityl 2-amino-2-deoxy-alpha-D-glucopyranoside ligase [Propioniciclava coleopterorum]|uniref:L-cysteine:1D-myo-inositol 2-amino-2-deoxy-alpha-D-glucopyranoside ligase n=1 Tax=Propioniciclava coleopterorum TaxID=2714937 RepID=A0A6G7Y8S2_9ACTN|nr:cysteine--1-D-myo-inosityl 2-amino-2-deoxy-alpha-D-glucopyranoside ligase [Propioniciclava coleopterorum]QIK73193.1 cysteine--1-D-myo-inosityl 2-amino-2-deoxy-alpha-D-glucopyranoside ligase [Propioniciclava coleopterorum]